MRSRFVAIAGPPENIRSLPIARDASGVLTGGWAIVLRLADLIIIVRDGDPSLAFSNGAVLGTLFERADAQPVRRATQHLEENIALSRGRCLIDDHWGGWFAIFSGEGHWALRDPSAFSPAYYRMENGVSFYFSDLEAALELGLKPGDPDPLFLRHWVTFPHLRTARTGLAGTSELLPGTRREVSARRASLEALWSPWTFAGADRQIAGFDDAAERVRSEALRVIPAQARGRGRLMLELSGGLDSSIVAAALKAGDQTFMSVNFVTRAAEGDERRYARAVAGVTSMRHFEIEEVDTAIELGVPERRGLRPGLSPMVAPLHRQFAAHGEQAEADAFLTGAGGDNVFCYLTTAAPLLDAWRRLGPGAALWSTLQHVSEMCGCTAWTTARFAFRKAVRSLGSSPRWRRDGDFLCADAAPALPEPHPWLDPPAGSLPGKREHVAALLRIQHVIDPETRLSSLPFIHPLIAQPLMELCLRIPTWLWVRDGRNRAVARQAFRGLLPDEVLDRRSKGRLEAMCLRAWLRHRPDIAELLLGGLLRQEGLLDADALESYFKVEGPPADARHFRIFELAAAELWLRSWRH